MRQWVVLSGKGGTGKTTVTAALAHLASEQCRVVMADADVDAANLELLLSPHLIADHEFVGARVAKIDADACTQCGICAAACRFDAVRVDGGTHSVDPVACEGCAACYYQCPSEAIRLVDRVSGRWFQSETRFGPLYHARLFAGQENSGKLVSMVKHSARLWAEQSDADLLLVDGPPGIGCPVIAAATGGDLALLVVEPTVSGVHDLERILGTVQHFRVPALVCINKADVSPDQAERIRGYCGERGIPVAGSIPYDEQAIHAIVHRRPVTVDSSGGAAMALRALWEELKPRLNGADSGCPRTEQSE